MRFTYFKITGYAGIYTGLGLHELEIDLSRSMHKIIVISGLNGCGKSTLLQCLNILPDDSSFFMDGVPSTKEIRIEGDNHLYEIEIRSGKKFQTKCSIKKDDVELNPNGNVTSYKDIIFSEFELDPNYISLSKISSDDRGLADMSPSERKKFMSFIIDTLGSYNDMYQILNKRSSIFKSHINTLHTKIQNIGDEENINNSKRVLEDRRDDMKAMMESLKTSIIEARTIISMNEKDALLIQNRFSELTNDINSLNKSVEQKLKVLNSRRYSLDSKLEENAFTRDYIIDLLNKEKEYRSKNNQLKLDTSVIQNSLIEKREFKLYRIYDLDQKKNSLLKGVDQSLRDKISELTIKVEEGYNELVESGINPYTTSDIELNSLMHIMQDIIDIISNELYMDMSTFDLQTLFEIKDCKKYLDGKGNIVNDIEESIIKTKRELGNLYNDKDTIEILKNRPEKCSIDDCFFLGNACIVECRYLNKPIDELINSTETKLKDLNIELSSAKKALELAKKLYEKESVLKRIYSICHSSHLILDKYPLGKEFIINLKNNMKNGLSFNKYTIIFDKLNNSIITLSIYKKDKESLEKLNLALNSQQNSEERIKEIESELNDLHESIKEIDSEMNITKSMYDTHCKHVNDSDKKINELMDILLEMDDYQKISKELFEKKNEFNEIVSKSKKNIDLMDSIASYETQIKQLEPQLSSIESQISNLNNQITMLESYKNEFSMYKDKYNMIEILKKHCSPTSGIQTLFIDLYMGKTLDLANQVIDMVFNGQFKLLPFVISPTEFSIPFSANGLPVNDISFGSTSQICMMGMAINLVLLYQASTKYNIATLDEIDGGLDNNNRMKFIPAVYKISDILGIDQLFIISHSLELELNNVDRIILKTDDTEIPEGNILYNFNQSEHQCNLNKKE